MRSIVNLKAFSGKSVHVYHAFVAEDRKRKSNSQYLGVIPSALDHTVIKIKGNG